MMTSYSASFNISASALFEGGAFALLRNTEKLVRYTIYGWGLGLIPILACAVLKRQDLPGIIRSQKTAFLLIWVSPALTFYALVHMGQQGLVFVFLPVLLLLSGQSAVILYHTFSTSWQTYAIHISLACLVVGNACIFVLAPEYLVPGNRFKILSWSTIKNLDMYFTDRISTIRSEFPPENTVLAARQWRHVGYYLPEYPLIPFSPINMTCLGHL